MNLFDYLFSICVQQFLHRKQSPLQLSIFGILVLIIELFGTSFVLIPLELLCILVSIFVYNILNLFILRFSKVLTFFLDFLRAALNPCLLIILPIKNLTNLKHISPEKLGNNCETEHHYKVKD